MLEWTPEYSVEIEVIDAQHKELFERISSFIDDIKGKRCKYTVGGTTKFLEDYVLVHFADEERFMKQAAYPQYDAHCLLHRRFVMDFNALKRELAGELSPYNRSVLINQIVVDWIVEHVTTKDRAFGQYLKESGISLAS